MTQATEETGEWPSIVEDFVPTERSYLKCLSDSDMERFNDSIAGDSTITHAKLLTWTKHIIDCECDDCARKLQGFPNVVNWRLEFSNFEPRRTALEDEMVAMRYNVIS